MITIEINNKFLALDDDFSMKIIKKNPLCFVDKIVGDTGVNITIPVNDNNKAILGNPQIFDKYTDAVDRKFPGTSIHKNGVELMAGTLIVQDATDTYTCWLQSDLGAMGEKLQEVYITDFNWPTDQTFVKNNTANDDTEDYGTQVILNPGFWDGIGKEQTVEIPYEDANGKMDSAEETMAILKYDAYRNYGYAINDFNLTNILPGCVISPYLHLRYVIKESLRLNKWKIERNDMITEDYDYSYLKNAKIYNNFNVLSPNFVSEDGEVFKWLYVLEGLSHNIIRRITNFAWEIAPFNYCDLLPKISYKEFLLGIQNTLNYVFWFRNNSKVHIIDRNEALNGSAIDIHKYFSGLWKMEEQSDTSIKFMPEYDKDDAMFGTIFKDLSHRAGDFKENVETIDDLTALENPEIGELRMVTNENNIYEYKWMVDENSNGFTHFYPIDGIGWEFISTGPQPFIYGDSDELQEITSAISAIKMKNLFYPEVIQRGNLKHYRSSWKDFTFRLIAGLPFFHSDSFYWEGPKGLFKKRWLTWARFWKSRIAFKAEFNFPLNMIVYVGENMINKFRTEDGEFIIETMETTYKLYEISPTTIKGYKI